MLGSMARSAGFVAREHGASTLQRRHSDFPALDVLHGHLAVGMALFEIFRAFNRRRLGVAVRARLAIGPAA